METEKMETEKMETQVAKRRGRPPRVSREMFEEMWNNASSLEGVAMCLGMSKAACSVKASNLRKQGCDLPQFTRGRKAKPQPPDAT